MFPNDPNNPPSSTPQPNRNTVPVVHPNGQYEVVPPLPTTGNHGHSGHNAYDFIMQPAAPKRKVSFSLGAGRGLVMRLVLILAGLAVLVIVAVVIASSFAPKGSTPDLMAIAERQQEIIRVSTAALRQTTGTDTTNFVTNVNLSVTTSQQQIINYLAAHATKVDKKLLLLDQNAQTDALLASAATANNYDPAVTSNLTDQLQTYETLLQNAYKHSSNKETKQLVTTCFTGADLLLQQAKALPQ